MIGGERSARIAAAPDAVWAVLADVERYVEWHPFFATLAVRERDAEGRVARAACTHGTPVGTLATEMAVSYAAGASVAAERVGGDLRALRGAFDLGADGGATRVTHRLVVDPGRRLGLILRGPVAERVRHRVLDGALSGLAAAVAAR